MKLLIRTKDIARVKHNEKHASDCLRITYTDGCYQEFVADHYEESMSQQERCKQLKQAYQTITDACQTEKEFVEIRID